MVSSFAITYFLVPNEQAEDTEYTNEVNLHAVAKGEYIPLEDVPDEVFSTKMMGDGFAIESIDGAIFAPVSGKVTTIFPSKHALGIKTSNGVEVLVHMGIDTVNLNGAGFDVLVKVGDQVTVDTKIAQMDLPYIHSQGKKSMVIVVITNMDRVSKFSGERNLEGQHQAGALLERALLNG